MILNRKTTVKSTLYNYIYIYIYIYNDRNKTNICFITIIVIPINRKTSGAAGGA